MTEETNVPVINEYHVSKVKTVRHLDLEKLSNQELESYFEIVDKDGNSVNSKIVGYRIEDTNIVVTVLLPNHEKMDVSLPLWKIANPFDSNTKMAFVAGGLVVASLMAAVAVFALRSNKKNHH